MGTTPTYSWPYPDDTDPVANGAQDIEDLALAVETTVSGLSEGGLVFISRTTIGSAVSSVTVSGAFSTDYDSYKIIVAGGAGSTGMALKVTLGATSTGYTFAEQFTVYASPSAQASATVNGAYWNAGRGDTTTLTMLMDIHSPFLTEYTTYQSAWSRANDAMAVTGGYLNDTTSYTAFTLTTSTGTMTGGTIDVYGYAKA